MRKLVHQFPAQGPQEIEDSSLRLLMLVPWHTRLPTSRRNTNTDSSLRKADMEHSVGQTEKLQSRLRCRILTVCPRSLPIDAGSLSKGISETLGPIPLFSNSSLLRNFQCRIQTWDSKYIGASLSLISTVDGIPMDTRRSRPMMYQRFPSFLGATQSKSMAKPSLSKALRLSGQALRTGECRSRQVLSRVLTAQDSEDRLPLGRFRARHLMLALKTDSMASLLLGRWDDLPWSNRNTTLTLAHMACVQARLKELSRTIVPVALKEGRTMS